MELLVYIIFDSPDCSRKTGVFEVIAIEMYPEIYTTDDFEHALGVYEHPDVFETFFILYDPLELVQVCFNYIDISADTPDGNYLDYEDLAALGKPSPQEPPKPQSAWIDLEKISLLNDPDTHYFKVPCLYDANKHKRDDVPYLYEGRYATLREVLKAVNHAMGNPTPLVELCIENFEERTAY